ncbi:fibronectin type III domain-containing protein [Flavobacterium sp. Fl-318]|uniref:Fibronectin type III domain-containing protein n=1 Tax=Flavobacterium cupriresistens TaxID=2893885 RepID=A0ABU4RF96_9FLAO|nr:MULTISPECIES: fibronectin type III domain-containing protein [unclassified Flavobacterium]MDX6191279.1 fibronectin type III domain-containing protein [Flavobacterium sp. Fl-318]UFH42403.1 fibronectin type III domain-containing protein [Flavobacterium sp. F-323]
MKRINFSHSGGFPLEQETLERLQSAYRSELYEALKRHLSIKTPATIGEAINYIIAPATSEKQGLAVIHQIEKNAQGEEKIEGILYPIAKGAQDSCLKTTRTGTSLVYGTGTFQTAYFDYEAQYISQTDYNNADRSGTTNTDALTVYYYELDDFQIVKDIAAIEAILQRLQNEIDAIENDIATVVKPKISAIESDIANVVKPKINAIESDIANVVKPKINAIESDIANVVKPKISAIEGDIANVVKPRITAIEGDIANVVKPKITAIEGDIANVVKPRISAIEGDIANVVKPGINENTNQINVIKDTYLPLDGSKAMTGNLTVGGNITVNTTDQVEATKSETPLLVLKGGNKIAKTDISIKALMDRLIALEARPAATGIPVGIVAIWGRPANQIPTGWKEYEPLQGRMPVGLYNPDFQERGKQFVQRSYYQNLTFYFENGTRIWPFDTLGKAGGYVAKSLNVDEMPPHNHPLATDSAGTSDMNTVVMEGTRNNDEGWSDTNTTGSRGNGNSFPLQSPYRVVQFIEYTGGSDPTIIPSTPVKLTYSFEPPSLIVFEWEASIDNNSGIRYELWSKKSGEEYKLHSTDSLVTRNFFAATNTTYHFQVYAIDSDNNRSLPSNELIIPIP